MNQAQVDIIVGSQPDNNEKGRRNYFGTVYRLIDQFGPISRIELSRLSHLAPASITKIVREMREAKLIQENEFQAVGNRGRPAIGLILNTAAWHYLSVCISQGAITLALRDFSHEIIQEQHLPLLQNHNHPLLEDIVAKITPFFSQDQNKTHSVAAIAITLSGIINVRSGIVHRMPFYQVEDMPLGSVLKKLTGLPIYIQHDIHAWTLAESLSGASRGIKNLINVVIDRYVGAGVISNGRLLFSSNHISADIGHIQVESDGKPCYCGNSGCLETIATIDSILNFAQFYETLSSKSLLHNQILNVNAFCNAVQTGDGFSREIIIKTGRRIGRILALMVNIFNPQKILIGSPLNRIADIFYPVIDSCIRQQSLPAYSEKLTIEPTTFSNLGTMSGAAVIKNALYDGSLLIKLLHS